ncbi:MAG: hypothetical protein FWE77_00820 [Clostridia bacterium]|nr:hypothetical protein [Clostridia bacterium]
MEEKAERRPIRFFARLFLLLRWLLLIALSLACVAVFYIAVVMGEAPEQNQADALAASTPMPSAAPLPGAVRSVDSVDLAHLQALFPAPLATLPAARGFVLQAGRAEDVRVSGAGRTCRVVSLTYSNAALPNEVVVRSAAPGAYAARYAQDAFTLEYGTTAMGKLPAMTLTVGDLRCYVAIQGEVVYAVEGSDGMAGLANVPGWVTVAEP